MNPAELIPAVDPYGVPAPDWVFVVLLNLTLVLHFIAMGYVFTATLLHVPLSLAAHEGSAARWMLRRTEGPLPVALSMTITLGVAPLLFVQVLYQPVFYNANILIGYQWFGIIWVLMAGFYLIYLLWGGKCLGRRVPRGVEAVGRLLIFLSILYVGVTMTVNALVGMTPGGWEAVRDSGGNFLLLGTPLLVPRLLHNGLAALIIGGIWLIALGARSEKMETGEAEQRAATGLRKLGGLVVLCGVALQIMVGGWLVWVESPETHQMLVDARPATLLWWVALAGALGLLGLGVLSVAARPARKLLWGTWGVLGVVLLGMFSLREAARETHLAPYMNIWNDWRVAPQISSLVLFLVLFVAALGIVGLMIKWMVEGWRGEQN